MLRARAACFVTAALVAATLHAAPARAEDWTYESDAIEARAEARLRFSGELGWWVATFERPARACDTTRLVEAVAPNLPGGGGASGCTAGRSSEVGLATGVAVAFRVASPVYLTAGLELMYTSPSSSLLKNQLVIPVPFGLLITPYDWAVRPILHATISPILYLTDDARDYTLGADVGLAWRVMSWGDLSLAVGYRGAETMSAWRVEVALHPVP